MTECNSYRSPFSDRYASKELTYLFSPHFKFTTWRKLWVALAKGEKALGLPITEAQIKAMEAACEQINWDKAKEYEEKFRHDVMAHIHAFGDQCPEAKGIIHLGATSCYVTDNTDLIQIREGLKLFEHKLLQLIRHLANFAEKNGQLACLSYTHLQAAQPTTVGKRASLWLQDFLLDFREITHRLDQLFFLGVKGATGTQASFLDLFGGDFNRVNQLELFVAEEMGFSHIFPISGQTYTRKQDIHILSTLASFASSAHKFATDLRLLSHLKEIEEPFSGTQVGSSAMPYKRNPMKSERVCGLARFLISLSENPLYTEATQWFERTLDDSTNRRLCLSEAFLAADAILDLLCHITSGLIVYPKVIERHLKEELPFLITESILMKAVKQGKDRQQVHEALRTHSLAAGKKIKEEGKPNDLLQRIGNDQSIGLSSAEIEAMINQEKWTGCAEQQTLQFLHKEVFPLLKQYSEAPQYTPQVRV